MSRKLFLSLIIAGCMFLSSCSISTIPMKDTNETKTITDILATEIPIESLTTDAPTELSTAHIHSYRESSREGDYRTSEDSNEIVYWDRVTYSCSCGESYTEELESHREPKPTEHIHSYQESDREGDYRTSEEGNEIVYWDKVTYICSCGESYTEDLESHREPKPTEHIHSYQESSREVDCRTTEEGNDIVYWDKVTYSCNCGDSYTEDIESRRELKPTEALTTEAAIIYTDAEVVYTLNNMLASKYSSKEYRISIDNSMVNIYFFPEGFTVTAYKASKLHDSNAIKDWNSLVKMAKSLSVTLSDFVHSTLRRNDLTTVLYFCDDTGSENVFLVVMNGIVYYDIVNGINRIG